MKTKLLFLMLFAAISFGYGQVTSVALVGEAAGGWPGDPGNPGPVDVHQMSTVDNVNWTLAAVTLTNAGVGGGVKFRANNDWTINWGAASFPNGTGTQGGANILCIGGTYDVEFNSTTGVYAFLGGGPVPVVILKGTAVSDPAGITMGTSDAENYTLNTTALLDGTAQFEIDGVLYGGDTFPGGVIVDNTLNIPVVAGTYSSITVNIATGDYSFTAAPIYPVISITGAAVGGWGDGFDYDMTTTDGITYTYQAITMAADQFKFRTNHDWAQPNYGGSLTAWPSGIADTTSPDNLAVATAGTYDATFNLTTGEYSFSVPTIAVVGNGAGGWPGDPGNPGPIDVNQMTTDDNGLNYYVNNITLTNGSAKFRTNNAWTVNYGAATFPTGTGTQGGADIPVVAGTYNILLNRATGAYNFQDLLATTAFNNSNFKVYPNPSQNVWNFASAKQTIQSIQIVDVLGKTVMTVAPKEMTTTVDASSLTRGLYFAKIATATATETVKLMKN